jgi:RimJ/RimL family protein N-acetyltransferase
MSVPAGNLILTTARFRCRDYAFTAMRVPRVVCMIRQENLPSLAVAAKLGMRRIGDIVYFGLPHWLFEYRPNAVASP